MRRVHPTPEQAESWLVELKLYEDRFVGLRDPTIETYGGERRYVFYRAHGLDVAAAHAATLAWERNTLEQRVRRVSHGTGATRSSSQP